MGLSQNQKSLIDALENLPELKGRFQNLSCINASDDARRGVLSLVFQAYDILGDVPVAIKFMDPDRLGDRYRLTVFEREPELLNPLAGKKRCLQLIDGLDTFKWEVPAPGSPVPLSFACGFFITNWLEEDVDEYFCNQHLITAREKLIVFRRILLAVESIHAEGIFHRDIKYDNVRAYYYADEHIVVLIDFGTAATVDSQAIATGYSEPVGANAYSAPEAFLGFAGDRALGHLNDIYALGSLLYQLFNKESFADVREMNTHFVMVIAALRSKLSGLSKRDEMMRQWKIELSHLRHLVGPPPLLGPGHTIPPSIIRLLNDIYLKMVEFDFTKRTNNLMQVRSRVDSALKVLTNHLADQKDLERKRAIRERKKEKIARKEARLDAILNSRRLSK